MSDAVELARYLCESVLDNGQDPGRDPEVICLGYAGQPHDADVEVTFRGHRYTLNITPDPSS